MENIGDTLFGGILKFASVVNGWIPRPPIMSLSPEERSRLIGSYKSNDGRNYWVTQDGTGFRICGLTNCEFVPINAMTLRDRGDPEGVIRFESLRDQKYRYMVATHPLRLTIGAVRVLP